MPTKEQQLKKYGRVLTGNETELELAQYARKQYLKKKMRRKLAADIGDEPDNIADLTRAIVLGLAISEGMVTDQQVITRYHLYIQDMVESYGGAESIMDILESGKDALKYHVVEGYFLAKQMISEAESIDEIRMIDLPSEPQTTDEI